MSNTTTEYTEFQKKVNDLPGALGPASSAFWKNTYEISSNAVNLNKQPLYYSPSIGKYVTSSDTPASQGSVNFSNFSFGSRSRRSRTRRSRTRRSRSRRWIQQIDIKKGSLRRLAKPKDFTKKGTLKKNFLKRMSKRKGSVGRKARFAMTLRRLSKRKVS
jgi:hypothetical protein